MPRQNAATKGTWRAPALAGACRHRPEYGEGVGLFPGAGPSAAWRGLLGEEDLEQGFLEHGAGFGEGQRDVAAQDFDAAVAVAVDDRLDDAAVILDQAPVLRPVFDLDAADEADACIDADQLADDLGIVGELGEMDVKAFVEFEISSGSLFS